MKNLLHNMDLKTLGAKARYFIRITNPALKDGVSKIVTELAYTGKAGSFTPPVNGNKHLFIPSAKGKHRLTPPFKAEALGIQVPWISVHSTSSLQVSQTQSNLLTPPFKAEISGTQANRTSVHLTRSIHAKQDQNSLLTQPVEEEKESKRILTPPFKAEVSGIKVPRALALKIPLIRAFTVTINKSYFVNCLPIFVKYDFAFCSRSFSFTMNLIMRNNLLISKSAVRYA